MSYFVYGGKLSYSDYLTARSFADDVTSASRKAGERVALEVSRQTREVIASNEALAAENIRVMEAGLSGLAGAVDAGFGQLSSALDSGFERLSYDLQNISAGISELNATFHWGFGQMLAGIGHMNDALSELIKIAKTPAQTAAYEQYEIARDAFRQGLYAECLEALDRAISGDQTSPGYKLEWRFHQMQGTVRLGFDGCDLALVDLAKAEQAFALTARYARVDYPEHAGQGFLSAGWAAYCQGKMKEALAYTEQAMGIHPRLGEAFFQAAKVRMALGQVDAALPVLAQAIDLDRFYALKAAGDGDFRPHDERLRGFLEALRVEKRCQSVPVVRAALDGLAFWREHDATVGELPAVRRLEEFLSRGAEWPLLDMLAVVQGLDRELAGVREAARGERISVTSRAEGAGEPLVREETYPVEETYQEEVVLKPGGFFRKAVTELRTRTRTVTKIRSVKRPLDELRVEIRNGLGEPVVSLDLVQVPGGTFEMGDTFGDGFSSEKPVHSVAVSDFCIGKHPVTQAQWEAVMGSNPSHFKGSDRPVDGVSWDDVQEFLTRLNGKTVRKFRLPTEAEWEYAARSGGKKEKWAGTSDERHLGEYAWYKENSGGQTQPVGKKKPNGLGLYDMSGNVWEWCSDWYDAEYYGKSPKQDPKGPSSGSDRVGRGGSWNFDARRVRAADRGYGGPGGRNPNPNLGFRLATVQ